MKQFLMMTVLLLSSTTIMAQEESQRPRLGYIGGYDVASFEPCVYRSTRGGWYDHCFFSLNSTNDFNEPVSEPAKQCAIESSNVLANWLEDKTSIVENAYRILNQKYGSKSIYIIVTDTVGSTLMNRNRATLWTYPESNGEGYYFKFNIGISNDGTCHIPSEAQMVNTIRSWVGAEEFDQKLTAIRNESAQVPIEAVDVSLEEEEEEEVSTSVSDESATTSSVKSL